MKSLRLIFLFGIWLICSIGFGQIIKDSTCLSNITDSIKAKYPDVKLIVGLNDKLISHGQEYCFPAELIKSIEVHKNMSSELNGIIESIIIDIKINQDINKLKPRFYLSVDTMPEFHGGMSNLFHFIDENFIYPPNIDACCKIYIQFTISETGMITDVKIVRGIHEKFDKELLRVFTLMPAWKPGRYNGRPVPVRLTLPIDFTIR